MTAYRPVQIIRNFASLAPFSLFLCAFGGATVALEVGLDGDWLASLPALALAAFGMAGLMCVVQARRQLVGVPHPDVPTEK